MTKTATEIRDILGALRQELGRLYGSRLCGLYVYGSYARDEADVASDLDVLVVLDRVDSWWDEIKRTSRVRAELSLQHDLTISLAYVSERDWRTADTPFLHSIRAEVQAA